MSLEGIYFCPENNSKFVVEQANVATGQARGYFEMDDISIPIEIRYHFENNVGPVTDLSFSGGKDDPNQYVGGAGRTNNASFSSIQLAGGFPTHTSVEPFRGEYLKQ